MLDTGVWERNRSPPPAQGSMEGPARWICHSLRSYKRQARSLRQWLELSREEPRSEDQEAEQQVQENLQEVRPQAALGRVLVVSSELCLSLPGPQVEVQIQKLAAELQARRQPINACIARVQALRRALC